MLGEAIAVGQAGDQRPVGSIEVGNTGDAKTEGGGQRRPAAQGQAMGQGRLAAGAGAGTPIGGSMRCELKR